MINELRLLLKMAKVVTTPREAILLLAVAGVIIALAYALPEDIVE